VKYHNGAPFNAAAVVANLDAVINDEVIKNQQVSRQLRGIPSARVIDELTVEFTTSKPDPILPRRLAIMRPHEPGAWADMGAEVFGRNPVGTGAYKVSEWSQEKIVGTAHTEGWRVPKIANLLILDLPEPAARVQALNSGQVDIAWTLRPDQRATVEAAGGKIYQSTTNNTLNLMLLHQKTDSPVSDVRVRRALNYAFNKQGFIDTVLGGVTVPASQPSTPGMGGHFTDIKPYPYDPAKAKALLAEAGYPNGVDLMAEIVVVVGDFKDTMEAMAADFKRSGINLELQVVSIPDFVKRVLGIVPWKGDAFSMMYEGYPSSDLARSMNTHSCLVRSARRAPHTCFEEIMPAINAMNSTFDLEKRDGYAREVAEFYHDNATAVFSHVIAQIDGMAQNVQGYSLSNRVVPFHNLEFANN
jgi:peptide/nickel transport system substrate-binding protein